jgi:hypothetical protein
MRYQDVDQATGHLVQVERRADLPEGVVQERVPHQGRVDEPLVLDRRHLQDGQRHEARGFPQHGLHAGHRLTRRPSRVPIGSTAVASRLPGPRPSGW